MTNEFKGRLEESIQRARNWAVDGWKATFGHNNVEVCSLKEAEEMPKSFIHRESAVAYWKNVEGISAEVATFLEGALENLEKGDLHQVENKLYAAMYFEKPLESFTNTSRPIYESFRDR